MSNPSHSEHSFTNYSPVSPLDVVDPSKNRLSHHSGQGPTTHEEKKGPTVYTRSRTGSDSSSSNQSVRTPRTARFAEATSVNSPVAGPSESGRSPFADPPTAMTDAQGKPSDVGFGYMADNSAENNVSYPVAQEATYRSNPNGPASPLKSALKAPGTPGRTLNPLSPTFREEQVLEKHEASTEKQNAKDLKVKFRVRMAKMVLRGVNFSCSLIVLSMLSTTFSIFNATRALPPRSGLPAWAHGTTTWPQITVLAISCVSLAFSIFIFYAYWRGGHKRAEKTAVYYTVFAVFFFAFSIIMWAVGAGILHGSKANGKGQDMWGWACKDNRRRQIFQDDVSYALVCRLQDWSLVCCIIEIVVEIITIAIYAIVFYRFYSKRKLRKSMDTRDKARSDLYLAQLRTSAPQTPLNKDWTGLRSPRSPYAPDPYSVAEEGNASPSNMTQRPFQLQPPPIRVQNATPKPLQQEGFERAATPRAASPPATNPERMNDHVEAAPGEQTYDAVPIPGAYQSPLSSPGYQQQHFQGIGGPTGPGQAY